LERFGGVLHIVDQTLMPRWRNRGLGSAITSALMQEAAASGRPLRLSVMSGNAAAIRLYRRLGFVPIMTEPHAIEMEWRAPVPGSEAQEIADSGDP
jgi:ribosomal protein S18 acetylase RimI-like enzyme